jgi:hypothetical protein
LNRFVLAFRSFFDIQLHGQLSDAAMAALGLRQSPAPAVPEPPAQSTAPAVPAPPAQPRVPPPARTSETSEGALQLLSILQRDARLIDFLMEDIAGYADDQVGAAVRELHDQCRAAVSRYVTLQPVIDGVEGAFTQAPSGDPNVVTFVGNVPAQPPSGGILRHKGWRAASVDLPPLSDSQDATILAPAEIEIE